MMTVTEMRHVAENLEEAEGRAGGRVTLWLTVAEVCDRLDRVRELLEARVVDGREALAECRAMAESGESAAEKDIERWAEAVGRAVAREITVALVRERSGAVARDAPPVTPASVLLGPPIDGSSVVDRIVGAPEPEPSPASGGGVSLDSPEPGAGDGKG